MNLGKVILFGVGSGIIGGIILTILVSFFSLIPIIGLITILVFPIFWLIAAIATPATVLYKIKPITKGDGIAIGLSSGLTLAIAFGILMGIASFFIAGINVGISGKEATSVDAIFAGLGLMFYIVIGVLGAIPSAIAGAISGWYFEKRWTIDKVEVVKTKP